MAETDANQNYPHLQFTSDHTLISQYYEKYHILAFTNSV